MTFNGTGTKIRANIKSSRQDDSGITKLILYFYISDTSTMSRQGTRVTDTKKVSGELFSLTYGALVSQIVKDYQNVEDVNKQLEKMGYNIGVRIIEDFLARTKEGKCTDFRDTADKVQTAFKMYLNVSPTVTSWSSSSDEFSLIFEVISDSDSSAFTSIFSPILWASL